MADASEARLDEYCSAIEDFGLEKLTARANDARGRVLVTILRQSRNLTEYRALRWLYVDSAEEKQRALDTFPSMQGGVC